MAPKKSNASKLDPFLDGCDRPACDDMVSMLKKAQAYSADQKAADTIVCPPNSAELGRSSWTLLHSMAAWYPDSPSEKDQTRMQQFMQALAKFYPCTWCALDFQKNLNEKPVRTSSRKELCQWLCEQHNVVNEKLGKPLFSCDMMSLDERWRNSTKPECHTKKP